VAFIFSGLAGVYYLFMPVIDNGPLYAFVPSFICNSHQEYFPIGGLRHLQSKVQLSTHYQWALLICYGRNKGYSGSVGCKTVLQVSKRTGVALIWVL
jgi:hypothetical protein